MFVENYWKIFLEIAILWYVIYMILLFMKGTRSEQLLKGLFIISIIFVVTEQLGLGVITWVLTRLFPISVIALVIIFQPELRRGLAQLGRLGLHEEGAEAVDEISDAAAELSRRRVGALIVIEREGGLKSYIESGTMLDAKVTTDLLVSIFMPHSPLHDGAVIIQRGRVAAAACVLPLPEEERNDLPRSLGMRHRAAVGISSETDAVSVIVSEETAAISIAEGGKLTRPVKEEDLAMALKNMFYNPIKKRIRFGMRSRQAG